MPAPYRVPLVVRGPGKNPVWTDLGSVQVAVRGLARKLVVVLVLAGLFSYLILPALIEDQIARRLQTTFGAPTKPDVQVSSSFPPAMLLGHIDSVQVTMDQASLQGAILYDARADLEGVEVSVPQLIQGDLTVQTESCSLRVEAPPILIDQNPACLSYLGLAPGY